MKSVMHRTSKRANSSAATIHHHRHAPRTVDIDGRHKRVWKACERCRVRKTKVYPRSTLGSNPRH